MKKKIKNILKYILTYSTIAILGATLFFTNLVANVHAEERTYEEGYQQGLEIAYQNNPLYNAELEYYFNLNTQTSGYNVTINNDYLNGSIYLQPFEVLKTKYNSIQLQDYVENTNLSYWKLTPVKEMPISSFNFSYQAQAPNTFDYAITFYFNDNTNYTYHNPQTTTLYSIISINFSSIDQLQNKLVTSMTWRRQYSYEIKTLNSSEYYQGYTTGLTEGYGKTFEQMENLEIEYQELQNNYNQLQQQYNELATNEYTFENLFWSVGSVPMAFLMQSFNVNVLGLNMRAIITGLITALVVIWAIKKLLK